MPITLPPQDLPREKLLRVGAANLSDTELVALMLGSGIPGRSVFTIAQSVVDFLDAHSRLPSVEELSSVSGIGQAKASLLSAALEFTRRRIKPEGTRIRSGADILPLVMHMNDRKQEHFICISLNGAHEVLALRTITVGLVNAAQVHPREVFADPIVDRACAIVVAHNHPSGELQPSEQDKEVTRCLLKAGQLLGIRLLDHIIFSKRGYYSFQQSGLMGL